MRGEPACSHVGSQVRSSLPLAFLTTMTATTGRLRGTDSMAYTGSALPFLLSAFDRYGDATVALDKLVILTGSQVPLFEQETPNSPLALRYNTDAFQNVCAVVAAAHSGPLRLGWPSGAGFPRPPRRYQL